MRHSGVVEKLHALGHLLQELQRGCRVGAARRHARRSHVGLERERQTRMQRQQRAPGAEELSGEHVGVRADRSDASHASLLHGSAVAGKLLHDGLITGRGAQGEHAEGARTRAA
jgi:hypothetical protein